ncbi:MAG: Rid family detoxifying hydrolase [Candidatus Aminicenantales bacterium]
MKKMTVWLAAAVLLLASVPILTAIGEEKTAGKKYFALNDALPKTPFSTAVLVRDTLYVSGTLATDPETGKFVEGPIAVQAERIIRNIEIVLKKAGFTLSDVVSTTVHIADFKEFGEFNAVFKKWFPQDPPTRATLQVSALAMNAKIEISAIAVR